MLRSFAWRCVTSGVKPSQRRHLRSLAFKLQVGIIRKCSCLRFHCSLFFFFSFFSSSSLQHVQFLHLGVSPAESRHTAAHSLLNKPEASQSQERLSCTQEKTSGAHTLRVSCSMVCVHPLAFCRTNLGTLTHTHTHTHIYMETDICEKHTHIWGGCGRFGLGHRACERKRRVVFLQTDERGDEGRQKMEAGGNVMFNRSRNGETELQGEKRQKEKEREDTGRVRMTSQLSARGRDTE